MILAVTDIVLTLAHIHQVNLVWHDVHVTVGAGASACCAAVLLANHKVPGVALEAVGPVDSSVELNGLHDYFNHLGFHCIQVCNRLL